jgi:hypothetical protein
MRMTAELRDCVQWKFLLRLCAVEVPVEAEKPRKPVGICSLEAKLYEYTGL